MREKDVQFFFRLEFHAVVRGDYVMVEGVGSTRVAKKVTHEAPTASLASALLTGRRQK
jgi:hypothetical protein